MERRTLRLRGKALSLLFPLLLTLTAGGVWAADIAKPTFPNLPPSNFTVEIDGVVAAGFTDVGNIKPASEVIEYKDGDDATVRKRPGRTKYASITLTHTVSASDALRAWYDRVVNGATERKSISVIFHNDAGQETMRYNLFNAWPCKWSGPSLNAKNSGHATEKIEFCMTDFGQK